MLIDNKTSFDNDAKQTVYNFLREKTSSGSLDLVSGFFSVPILARMLDEINQPEEIRMILGNLLQDKEGPSKIADLISGELNIDAVLKLNSVAEKAIHFLEQEKVKLKTVESSFCHAKTYIYHDHNNSSLNYHIVGSSNLTEAGLGLRDSSNIELNQALTGSDFGFKDVEKWFGMLWQGDKENKAVAVGEVEVIGTDGKKKRISFKEYIINLIKDLSKKYTPIELYYKVLFELFKEDILSLDSDPDFRVDIGHLEETQIYKTLFPFQKKGVMSLIKMLKKHNGAILADAVGLGKTWQALAVIKYFELKGYKVVLLCPKKLSQNWSQYQYGNNSKFEHDRLLYWVRYHTDLQEGRLEKYANPSLSGLQNNPKLLVVIDESHNLRNDKSSRYQFLVEHILQKNRDVKVLQLSATPINNHLTDVRNQFKLIGRGNDDGFKETDLEIGSLKYVFAEAQKEFTKWTEVPDRKISDLIQKLNQHFFNLSDSLIVSRTRKLIEEQFGKLNFPEKEKPINEFIGMPDIGKYKSFQKLLEAIQVNLTAYKPSEYVKRDKPKSVLEDEAQREKFLVKMMYILMVKRLESSWYSFQLTVNKILTHHENALNKVNLYIQHKQDALIETDTDEEMEEDTEEDETWLNRNAGENTSETTSPTLGKKNPIALSSILNIEQFKTDLEADVIKLRHIQKELIEFAKDLKEGKKKDQKIDTLIAHIERKRKAGKNKKVVVFTAYKDTAEYLFRELRSQGYKNMAMVSGQYAQANTEPQQKKFETILERFAPYTKLFKEKEWKDLFQQHHLEAPEDFDVWKKIIQKIDADTYTKLQHPIDLLITTDCLSEGQNLQDADCVINYDIHWNPVRLIQRFGRIDRIGSPNSSIMCINFWPGKDFDDYIDLKDRVERRMAIMTLVGTEVHDTTSNLEQMLAENPMLSKHEKKLLEQMQTTWKDLDDDPQVLGFDDLSLEKFRQELLDYFQKYRKELEAIPNGVFTGFKARVDKETVFPSGIIALLGYPCRKENDAAHKYQDLHLMYTTANGQAQFINHKEVLEVLRLHKDAARVVPHAVEQGDSETLQGFKHMLQHWFNTQIPFKAAEEVSDLFSGQLKPAEFKNTDDQLKEEYYQMQNFDLITWFVVNS